MFPLGSIQKGLSFFFKSVQSSGLSAFVRVVPFFSLFQKAFQGHPLDPEHLKKELGDALWMLAEACTAMGWTIEDVAQANIDKLKARYPEGFSADRSLHRKEGDI